MIARVEGVLCDKSPTRIVVDVAGVGYELHVSLHSYAVLPDEGKTLAMHVHTHVREDAIQLFGFASRAERDVFELLLRASRVGPRLAQTVLSGMAPDRLLASLRASDVTALCKIPGVGRKLAERMVVELRDRAAELALEHAGADAASSVAALPAASAEDEALSALTNLGYPRAQAEKVVAAARAEAGDEASTEALIRAALRAMAG